MINSDILTNQYIDTFLQSESSFLYAVINDDSLSKTAVKVEEGWYCNKHDIYKRVFTDMLNGFKYNIEKNVIPISMSKLIGELGVWAIAVKMPYGKTNEITVFPRFAQNQEETYWRGELDSKVFYEIQKIENKELKDKAGLMIPKFLKMFDETRLKLKTESNEIPDIYCYIFYPCYDISVFRGTISMATSKPIEPDRLRAISSVFLNKFLNRALRRVESESLKSAKAAIMSRNMSHNLGSHVMFYIKQKLQSVSKIVDSSVLENIILPRDLLDIETLKNRISENTNFELPFLVGLGNFINYLQERQDYIATIATDYIPANSTISFKDFIYDELKPDLRYKRHHADNTDAGWQPGNLLLDYIAYSEQYRSSDDIVIKFNEFNGENAKDESDDFKELRKFNIAVPGGVIGRQALFSIFENIIRNAAKHSGRRNDNKLVLQLSLLDKDNNLFKSADFKSIRNDDNAKYDASGNILKAKYEGYFDKYHVLRIKIDMPNDAKTVNKLVEKLADPYLEETGNMKESSKGLKEMRISAAWLRGYSIDTEIPANEPPALSIYSEPYSGDKTKVSISYIICIPKPCRVAFIVQYDDCTAMNKMLAPYGCKVFTHEQLSDEKFIDEIANFEIVCMSKKDKNICSYLSSRNIINGNHSTKLLKNLIKSIEKTDYDAIEDSIGSVYETWFNNTYSHAISTMLCVADEQANQKNKKDKSLSNDDRVILTETGRVHEDDVKDAIVYSTHFKGLASKSDDDKYNKWLENAISIESVTGNNSTARLIRQDEWNKKWKTKLISAGLAKVAIFDERIFSSFISRKSITPRDGLNADVIIEEKKKFKNYGDFENELYKKYRVESSDALKLFTAKNRDQICKILKKYSITYTYDVAQKNHERRIWAFDVRLSEINPNEVEIVGYNTYIGERVGKYIEHKYDVALPIDEISYPEIPMARIS